MGSSDDVVPLIPTMFVPEVSRSSWGRTELFLFRSPTCILHANHPKSRRRPPNGLTGLRLTISSRYTMYWIAVILSCYWLPYISSWSQLRGEDYF
ncbi:hypothetical protein P154DRAFT_331338 [Amniculicola lignicola CBS 123094]|uniref:Uncharacterized protein n=1 Tax=Amniculicola lignicola CBS 123094 TaxID=1392246 RepID=A0A6A5W495_9PLEO|nr:hypothetical protein P154DRAFT_331338 [Amniculicola lignicola CBS 123094]